MPLQLRMKTLRQIKLLAREYLKTKLIFSSR